MPAWASACGACCWPAISRSRRCAPIPRCLRPRGWNACAIRRLRRYRRAEAVRLVFRDVNGLDEVTDTLAGTTDLYETLIAHALRHAERSARARHGTPRNADGAPQALVVFALG